MNRSKMKESLLFFLCERGRICMNEKLLNTPIETDENDDYGKDIITFRNYVEYMLYPEPIYIKMSTETANVATEAINQGLNIWKVYRALCNNYCYQYDEGREFISFPDYDSAKEILDTMLWKKGIIQKKSDQEEINESKHLYVAYGSNLNKQQMAIRCPTAKLYATGIINDYELQFKGSDYSAFATIGQKSGAAVPVAVWEIQPFDERSLDIYEGFPTHYYKQDVPVILEHNEEINAMVYIMNPKMHWGMPSQHYYNTVFKGYMDCGLDIKILNNAVKKSIDYYKDFIWKQQPLTLLDNDLNQPESEEDDTFDKDKIVKSDEYNEDSSISFSDEM